MEQMNSETIENITTNDNNFLDSISEEFRNEPSLKDFKDINGLAKSYINVNRMIGKSDIPNDKSSSEDWNKYYTKIGRPNTSSEYTTEKSYNNLNEDFLNNIKETCFNSGITNKQFNNIVSKYIELEQEEQNKTLEDFKQQEIDFINNFNNEFGSKAEEVKQNTINFLNKNVSEEDREIFNNIKDEKTTFALARLINNIYNQNSSEGTLKGTSNFNSGMSLADINRKMSELKKNNSMAYDLKEYQDLEKMKLERYSRGETLITE